MKLWRKNKRINRELPSFVTNALQRFNYRLIKFANFLQQKTNGYSLRRKKILLLLFVTVFITESTIVIIQSTKQNKKHTIAVARIKRIPIEQEPDQAPIITRSEFLKIQGFKAYVDSLSTTAKGRKLRDSLLTGRPQLMDSVNFLINLYLEQLKTK
jgi:hypothetical protein